MNNKTLIMPAEVPHQSWKTRLVGWGAGAVLWLVGATLRKKIIVDPQLQLRLAQGPVIFLFWHNRIFVMPVAYARAIAPHPVSVLTSASKDGALLAQSMAFFGIGAVRGSSSKRGAVALVQMKRLLAQGCSMAITPDGPRGPKYVFAGGALKLAELAAVPLVPVEVKYQRFWALRSWDGFRIPKPFSRVEVVFHAPTPWTPDPGLEGSLQNILIRGE
jgi:hypothetical protein